MKKEFLKRLYWACAGAMEPFEDGLNLSELYERTDAAKAVSRASGTAICKLNLTANEKTMLENLSVSVADAYEEQGFINGFRLGMKLAGELRGEAAPE